MQTESPQRWQMTILGRPVTPWHGVWAGAFSLLGSVWLLSTAVFAWPSQQLPAIGGAVLLPLSFLTGLAALAFSIVALYRRRDWRLALAALLGLAGVIGFAAGFLIAAGGVRP